MADEDLPGEEIVVLTKDEYDHIVLENLPAEALEELLEVDPIVCRIAALSDVPLDGKWDMMHAGIAVDSETKEPIYKDPRDAPWNRYAPHHHLASSAADSAVLVLIRPTKTGL